MFNIEKRLNPSQYAAVTTIDGPVLVIAGAGSGKTRVIEYRVLNLVRNKINPASILLLTFTRRAAHQMIVRTEKHDPRCRDVEGGTFHSFCYKMLKRYAKTIGFPRSFSILDGVDSEELIQKCCIKLGFFKKEKRFPKKDTLRNIISMCVNKNIPIKEVLKKEYPHFLEYAFEIKEVRREYTKYKIDKNFLDYDDLLVYFKLLLEKEEVRSRISGRYRYIMVDEYQDTNALQGDITYFLGKDHRNVMVVGDDAQSIYGFRGTSHKNIMSFPKKFPEARIIKLEENYRSTQSILDVGNSVLENMKNRYSKCLVSARKVSGDKANLLFFKDAYKEAEWIAGKIKQFRDEGLTLRHQAVLFRSSYISIPLQAELSKRNIPYQVFGGLKFYETAHVKDVMAHLKVIANPRDELSWNRILMLIEGIGPRNSERIFRDILAHPRLDDIVKKAFPKYTKGYRFSNKLKKFQKILKSTSNKKMDAGRQFETILEYYQPFLQNKFDDWPARLNDLETLSQISTKYRSLEQLLADFAIEPPERGVGRIDPHIPDDEKPLTLSTIHSAKGLEWDTVFLIGVMDGALPVSFSIGEEEDEEEEHRLFYVGITRAKNRLFLSMHHEGKRGGISQFNKISRFVDMPNVLSKLNKEGVFEESMDETSSYDEAEDLTAVYDKDSLLKRVIDYLD